MGYTMLWVELTVQPKEEVKYEELLHQLKVFNYELEYKPLVKELEPYLYTRKMYTSTVREDIRELRDSLGKLNNDFTKEEEDQKWAVVKEYFEKEYNHLHGYYFEIGRGVEFGDYLQEVLELSKKYPLVNVQVTTEDTSDELFRWFMRFSGGEIKYEQWGYPYEYKVLEYTDGKENDIVKYVVRDKDTNELTITEYTKEEHNKKEQQRKEELGVALKNSK